MKTPKLEGPVIHEMKGPHGMTSRVNWSHFGVVMAVKEMLRALGKPEVGEPVSATRPS